MNDKLVFRLIFTVSIIVFLLVVLLNRKVLPAPTFVPDIAYFLPKLNAIINGTCSILLLISLYFIRAKNIEMHKRLNIITFALSSVFLISYVLFHYFVKETHYGGDGALKSIYYFILITHIVLAAIVLPLILLSFYRGLQMQVDLHKKLVRWSYPIWLYVTVTGVIVYLMISPYYQF
jgi:putative membrane protein